MNETNRFNSLSDSRSLHFKKMLRVNNLVAKMQKSLKTYYH